MNLMFSSHGSMFDDAFSFGFPQNTSAAGGFPGGSGGGTKMKKHVRPAPSTSNSYSAIAGEDIHHTFKASLADMYYGRATKFLLATMTKCSKCDGHGCFNPSVCRICKGSGRVVVIMLNQFSKYQEYSNCENCSGSGIYSEPDDKCPNCNGGYHMQNKILQVNIPPGLHNGDRCVLQGEADEGKNIVPGDVIIHIQETPHPFLVRKNNDLFMEYDIDLKTALLGGSIVIHDFIKTGENLKIHINSHGDDDLNDAVDPAIKHGEIVGSINLSSPKIVKGMGMPINTSILRGKFLQKSNDGPDVTAFSRGDLFIKFNVQIPSLAEFASVQDIALLQKVLPQKLEKVSPGTTTQELHLSNLDGEGPKGNISQLLSPSKSSKESSRKLSNDLSLGDYDYDGIDLDSDCKEEQEDDIFYAGEWSKEIDDESKKRRKVNDGKSGRKTFLGEAGVSC